MFPLRRLFCRNKRNGLFSEGNKTENQEDVCLSSFEQAVDLFCQTINQHVV